jgi:hypothetical protein
MDKVKEALLYKSFLVDKSEDYCHLLFFGLIPSLINHYAKLAIPNFFSN